MLKNETGAVRAPMRLALYLKLDTEEIRLCRHKSQFDNETFYSVLAQVLEAKMCHDKASLNVLQPYNLQRRSFRSNENDLVRAIPAWKIGSVLLPWGTVPTLNPENQESVVINETKRVTSRYWMLEKSVD